MATCANCNGWFLFGGETEGENRFCCQECFYFFRHPGFCESCTMGTTDEALGGTYTVNLVFGTRLMGFFGDHCATCYSTVKRKWFWFIPPLFPVSAAYRVIYVAPSRYISRKLRPT